MAQSINITTASIGVIGTHEVVGSSGFKHLTMLTFNWPQLRYPCVLIITK